MSIFSNEKKVEYTFKFKVLLSPSDITKIPDIKGYLGYILGKHFELEGIEEIK